RLTHPRHTTHTEPWPDHGTAKTWRSGEVTRKWRALEGDSCSLGGVVDTAPTTEIPSLVRSTSALRHDVVAGQRVGPSAGRTAVTATPFFSDDLLTQPLP